MANFVGTAASEALVGTGGDDVVVGGGGTDRIDGAPGDDVLTGGDEADRLYGEAGDDELQGGGGADYLDGGAGDDVVRGGEGDDVLISDSAGADSLHGDGGNDQLSISRFWSQRPSHVVASGGAGEDLFNVQIREGHSVAIDAGEGDDYIRFIELYTSAAVTLGAGRDWIDIGSFEYYAQRGGRVVVSDFTAGVSGDILYIDFLLERLTGWNPALNPFASGHLRLVQSGSDVVFSASLAANGVWLPMVTFKNASAAAFTAQNFGGHAPAGGAAATAVTGTDVRETLTGGAGDDVVDALGGNDRVLGGAGNDQLRGGDGNDYLDGNIGDDVVEGGAGNDSVLGGYGDDQLHGGAGNDNLHAGATGADQMFGEEGDDSLTLSRTSTQPAQALLASGGVGNDTITLDLANAGVATVDAGDGNDRIAIRSLSGSASLTLGAGQDSIDFAAVSSVSLGNLAVLDFAPGTGGDRVELLTLFTRFLTGWTASSNPFETGHARLLEEGGSVRLQIDSNGGANAFVTLLTFEGLAASALTAFNLGGFAPDGGTGSALALAGGADPDWLIGEEGADQIDGLGGDDRLFGNGGADDLDGGEGDDRIDGGAGDDLIEGGEGLDQLAGGAGNDQVSGGGGNDVLTESGSGSDTLSGGDGDDTIRITRTAGTDQLGVNAGLGDDFLSISSNSTTGVTADLGEGADRVELRGTGAATITLGGGRDLVDLNAFSTSATVAITDFAAGDAGDRLDFDHLFAEGYYVTDGSANPFTSGFLRLVQSGGDVILQRDQDGTGTSYAFVNWLTLKNIDLWSLTSANFDGYALPFAAGTAADELFQGTALDDMFKGGGGDDVFRIGYGGSDIAIGGSGSDLFYVSLVETGVLQHKVEGSDGHDLLVLQGNRGTWTTLNIGGTDTISRIDASGIEGLVVLSATDASHGGAGAGTNAYRIFLNDGIAAAGVEFVIDGRGLTASESLKFGTNEADAPLRILGGAGDDDLNAGPAGARIEGNGGNDNISGGAGSDVLIGGAGSDLIENYSNPGTSLDIISGGDDNDHIEIFRTIAPGWGEVRADGDAGADTFELRIEQAGTTVVNGGAGNDLFQIYALAGSSTITLGAGSDRIDIYEPGRLEGQGVTVTDFDPTETIGIILSPYLQGHDSIVNPFGAGRLRLVQDGADVLFQADRTAQGSFATLLRFQNLTVADFQNSHIGGWMIFPVNGTEGDDEITGTIHADMIYAGGGNDLLKIQQGGIDKAHGGAGDDVFVLGNHLNEKEEIDGGEGHDTVLLQGTLFTFQGFVPTVLGQKSLLGIETLRMLPGDDTRFGAPGNQTYFYKVTTVDANVAPGATLIVDASLLRVGESAEFNGTAELDGRFEMTGGRGNDKLTGGLKDDSIGGGEGDDTLVGGSGADRLTGGAGKDSLDGGTGSDIMAGGLDDDSYFVDSTSDIVTETAGEGLDKVSTALIAYTLPNNVEILVGTSISGQFLDDNSGDNVVTGGAGSDTIRLDRGGSDRGVGGGGSDTIIFGAAFDPSDIADGGLGNDTVSLNGAYSALTLSGANLIGIESLLLGYRISSAPNVYNLTTADSLVPFNSRFTITASNLFFDEVLTFNGSAETDGWFEVTAGSAPDRLTGGAGRDRLEGGEGNDILDGGAGADYLIGGLGNDIFVVDNLSDLIVEAGAAGSDEIRTALASYALTAANVETLRGLSSSGQTLTVALTVATSATIIAGTGDDTLDDGSFPATLRGGLGDDVYIVRSPGAGVAENAGEGTDTVRAYTASYTLTFNVEILNGMLSTGQTLVGNDDNNRITGGSGHDSLDGRSGSDVLDGAGGDDILTYKADSFMTATDVIVGGAGNDLLIASFSALSPPAAAITYSIAANPSGGFDGWFASGPGHRVEFSGIERFQIEGSVAGDEISGGSGNDVLDGRQGADRLIGALGNDAFVVDNALDQVVELAGEGQDEIRTYLAAYTITAPNVEILRGESTGQALTAGIAGVIIVANIGNETLDDGGFAVTLQGLHGDDVFVVRNSATVVVENAGQGADTVHSHLATYTLGTNFERLVGKLSVGQVLTGNGVANQITGGAGDDSLDGGAGSDTMAGGDGNDIYHVDSAGDVVNDSAGIDEIRTSLASYTIGSAIENLTGLLDSGQSLYGHGGDNVVRGGGGDDLLAGAAGNDSLWGGAANDTLHGGTGGDTMRGGLGNDVYYADSLADSVLESAGEGTDEVLTALASYTLAANVENLSSLTGSSQDLRGNALDNVILGSGGETIFRMQDGGADKAWGNFANDIIYFGAAMTDADEARGGEGTDLLVLQGDYSAGLTFGLKGLIMVETLQLLSHANAVYDGSGATPNSYRLTTVDSNVLAGALLTVDAGGLAAGESLGFNGAAETDGRFAITGGLGDDTLTGGAGNDVITGGGGGDIIDGGLGADSMAGGVGDDVYRVDNVNDTVAEQPGGGADRVLTSLASYTLGADLEGVLGLLDTGQSLTGNASGNSLIGGGGNDVFDGGGGDLDYIEGHGGDDRFLIKLLGNVAAYGGSGIDTLVIDYSNSATFIASFFETAADGHWGGVRDEFGNNTVSFSGIERFDIVTGIHNDNLKTGDGDDRLVLGDGDDRAETGGGNDRIEGGAGNDTLIGGDGDDLYFVDAGDTVTEAADGGVDEVRTALGVYTLAANVENLTGTAGVAQDLRGNSLDNVLVAPGDPLGHVTVGDGDGSLFRLQDGGADRGVGGGGDDVFWFGTSFGAGDSAIGGAGMDEVVLQGGGYGALSIGSGMLGGIQKLTLLSAADARFGAAATGSYSYGITLAADALDPALYALDHFYLYSMLIDGRGLGAAESLTVDASALAAGRIAATGGASDDRLLGGAGNDSITDGVGGDDVIEGGAGDDTLQDYGGGSDVLRGGEGNDDLYLYRSAEASWVSASLDGGDGADTVRINTAAAGTTSVNLGAGDDRLELHAVAGSVRASLGSGRDLIDLRAGVLDGSAGPVSLVDFQAGPDGDALRWESSLVFMLVGWTRGSNPFDSGHARLLQSGADTLLQLSFQANGQFVTVLRFEDRPVSGFTADNFEGWAPTRAYGGSASDQLTGTASSDFLSGEGGNDFFYLQAGGEDRAYGGTGNDVVYFGAALSAGDVADGGEGRDAIVLQGNVTAVLSDSNLVGIESISIQSGANAFFGDTANNFYDYSVTTADGNVAAGQQLIVNAQSLRADEDFTFDGSAETDGKFLIYGGHGVDRLTGGDGNDIFFFEGLRYGSSDKVAGGAGRDSVVIAGVGGLNHIEFAEDAFTGIESISVNNLLASDPTQKPSYELVLANGNVAPGRTLILNGNSLTDPAQTVSFDGSAVLDGHLTMFGGRSNDALIGGAGNDLLYGGAGGDDLTGGAGADTFRYDSASDSTAAATDAILGFQSGADRIDLSRIDADSGTAGNQAFSWIGAGAFSGAAGQLRVFQSGGGWIVEGDTDGDGDADLVISVSTEGAAPLTQADFLP